VKVTMVIDGCKWNQSCIATARLKVTVVDPCPGTVLQIPSPSPLNFKTSVLLQDSSGN